MESGEIFSILGIEPTRDTQALKAAYRRLLVHVNPEDDPAGFQRLRQAYEEAVRLAEQPPEGDQGEAQERDYSPMGLWIQRAEQIYASLSRRISLKEWQDFLRDDVCQALDTSTEARERLLVFLMSHFRLPHEVWELFDREFLIVEQKNQLLEKFPRDFMNYICFEIENGGFIDYSLFDGEDDAPYDQYISLYLQVKRLTDSGEDGCAEQARQLLDQMEGLHIFHPFVQVERLRLAMMENDRQETEEWLALLQAQDSCNPYVLLQLGAALGYLGRTDEARAEYERLLEEQPDNYPAAVGLTRCQLAAGEYEMAKDRIMDLMDISKNDQQLLDMMREANQYLIPEREERLAANPDDWDERIELGWCYFQEERADDCIRLLGEVTLPEDKRLDYCNMLSRTYLMQRKYDLSLPLLEEWQQLMKELPDSEDPEIRRKKRRLGYTWYAIGFCRQELGQKEEAVGCYDTAISLERDEAMLQSYMMAKAQLLCGMGRYEESADACDRLIGRNEQYMPAYVCREECSYRMHRAQAVVDDYHRAVELYPAYLPPYLMAAKVFYFYRQYKDSMGVIEAARKQGLTCAELDLFEARNLRFLAEKKEDLERPKELCRSVIDQLQNADPDRESQFGEDPIEEGEVWKELVFCYMDEKNWQEAMAVVTEAIKRAPGEDGLLYAKAGILKGLKKYKESEELYRQLLKNQPDNTVIMGQLADCLEKENKTEGLEKLYQKILEYDEDDIRALSKLMHIYQDRMNDRQDIRLFEPALKLADRLVKLRPSAYYYIERGLLYSDVYRLTEALADYEKAKELEPDNLYAYNNTGVNLQHLDRYEEAEENYRKAIGLLNDEDRSVLPWKNLAVICLIQGRYEEALKCVAENEKLFPGRGSFYADRAEILKRQGRYEEAIAEYNRYLKEQEPGSLQTQVDIADAYGFMGKIQEADKRYSRLYKDHSNSRWVEKMYIIFMMEISMDYKGAYRLLKSRLADPRQDNKDAVQMLEMMVEACYYLKKGKERARYYEKARKLLEGLPMGEESYVGLEATAPSRLYHLGKLHVYGGDWQKAEACFERMRKGCRCDFCHYGGCYEAELGMGVLRLVQGRFAEAAEHLRRSLEINRNATDAAYYLKICEKKL